MNDIKTGTIQISGLAELTRRLEAFPDKLAKNMLSGAIRAGAVVIQKEARRKAPVGDKPHWIGKKSRKSYRLVTPGNLKKNIKVRVAPRKSRDVPITYWIYVSKKAWYWRFVEFGTSKMSSIPFMRPAFEEQKQKALEAIRSYLAARIYVETLLER